MYGAVFEVICGVSVYTITGDIHINIAYLHFYVLIPKRGYNNV